MKKPVIENSDNVINFLERIPLDAAVPIAARAWGSFCRRQMRLLADSEHTHQEVCQARERAESDFPDEVPPPSDSW